MKRLHPIRILVADDHLVARIGVSTILNTQPDMVVVGQARDGNQAVEMYKQYLPDVALIDLRMPIMSGIDAAILIRQEHPDAKIIMLTTYGGQDDIRRALAAGVKSYLTKEVQHEELVKAIRTVYAGKTYIPQALLRLTNDPEHVALSPREVEVLELIVQGLANKEIAHMLNIAEDTVKNHVKHIFGKLHVHDRTQAVTTAIQRGLIHLP